MQEVKTMPIIQGILITILCLGFFHYRSMADDKVYSLMQADSVPSLSFAEAVRQTIKKQPNIQLVEEQVEANKGSYQQQGGQFDIVLTSSVSQSRISTPLLTASRISLKTSKTTNQVTEYNIGVSKELRHGIVLNPSVNLTNTNDLVLNAETINRATVNFSIKAPLLRNRGKSANAADEEAARISYESSKFSLRQTISGSILNVVQAYWNTLAAMNNYKIAKETEERAKNMHEKAQILVDAGELPAAELDQLAANLAGKTADRIESTQSLFSTKQTLGLAMGLHYEEIVATPLPSDLLPESVDINHGDFFGNQNYIEIILKRRDDHTALKMRQESANVLLVSAKKNLRSRLDLDLDFGYTGLNEQEHDTNFKDHLHAFIDHEAGLNVRAMFSFERPLYNSLRRGTFALREAEYKQAVIRVNDLARTIVSNVSVAISDVINSAAELKKAHESVLLYRTAVEKEKKKLKLGMGTIINLIDIDDRLTLALLNEVSAKLNYNNAIIRLRFEMGFILSPDTENNSIDIASLKIVPSISTNVK